MDGGNPPRLNELRSTERILRQSSISFNSNFLTFFLISLLLLSFRLVIEDGAHRITSLIDRDPSLKLLISRLNVSESDQRHPRSAEESLTASPRRHRRRSFLHLTRVGTLDEDFLSGDSHDDRSLFGSTTKSNYNGSFVIYNKFDSMFPFSDQVVDDGVRVFEIVRPGVKFRAEISSSAGRNRSLDPEGKNSTLVENDNQDIDRVVDMSSFVKNVELSGRDVEALFFLVSLLSAAYGCAILAFVVTYASVLGVVFIAVLDDLVGRFSSYVSIFGIGSKLGLKRLCGFILVRWAVRDALTQLLGLCFFGEIDDQYSFFKLFMSLKLMPFSIVSPWFRGFEKEMPAFLFSWYFLDMFVDLILAVDAWVLIVDKRLTGRQVVSEGWFLISTMFHEAVQIKCLEAIVCGSFVKVVVGLVLGKHVAMEFQSLLEVYFMVVWLLFYFGARTRDNNPLRRRFELRELEGLEVGLI